MIAFVVVFMCSELVFLVIQGIGLCWLDGRVRVEMGGFRWIIVLYRVYIGGGVGYVSVWIVVECSWVGLWRSVARVWSHVSWCRCWVCFVVAGGDGC